MRRPLFLLSFSLLCLSPVWAQFQPAPVQQPYPQDVPGGGYPPPYQTQQQQYPNSPPQQQYPVQGQQQQQSDPQDDRQHGVARLRIVQGDVNIKRGDNGLLTAAIMNAPILSHDHLETGPGSRGEVQLDNATVVRLAPDSDIGFANLVFGNAQAQLGIGSVVIRILQSSQTQIELDTPSVAFHPLTPGEYRISVFDNGTTQVSVRAGRLEMSGPRGSQNIEQGQSLMVRGDAADPEFQQAPEPPRDQFDEWSASRDGEMMPSRSAQYVAPDVYGAEDLDHYGNWVPSAEYGQVWTPQGVGPDWSPYSNGQWSYADYYGWTWIGYEPWGWAPYHYGRWFHNAGVGWCWWPGERLGFGGRWSPGLVSFFGFGSGLGWVSLAPYESYHPWWGRGFGGYAGFRAGYDLHGFRNAGFRGGAVTAGFNNFAGAGHRYSFATAGQLRSASIYRGGVPLSPGSSAFRFSERQAYSNPRFNQANGRSFFNRSASPSFNNSRYGSQGSFSGSRYATPSAGSGNGWQRFGSAAPQRQQAPPAFTNRSNSAGESGWHNFGAPNGGRSYGGGAGNYRAPVSPNYNYRTPSATPHYTAPAAPHYNAPAAPRGNGGAGGARPSAGGGGGGHSSGGGGGGGGHHR